LESINLKGEWGEGNYLISLELFLEFNFLVPPTHNFDRTILGCRKKKERTKTGFPGYSDTIPRGEGMIR
jgi:hypothetical protein